MPNMLGSMVVAQNAKSGSEAVAVIHFLYLPVPTHTHSSVSYLVWCQEPRGVGGKVEMWANDPKTTRVYNFSRLNGSKFLLNTGA